MLMAVLCYWEQSTLWSKTTRQRDFWPTESLQSTLLGAVTTSSSRLSPHESIESIFLLWTITPADGYYMEPLGAGFIIYDANYCNQIMRCSVPLKDGLYIDLEYRKIFKIISRKETCDSYDSQLSLARPSKKRVSERLYSIIYMNGKDILQNSFACRSGPTHLRQERLRSHWYKG